MDALTGNGDPIPQVAALPYRFDDGKLEVMLITSRGAVERWVPPKGNLMAGLAPHEAAAQEAYEEAGVLGSISANPLGTYRSFKTTANGMVCPLSITLFPMRFVKHEMEWPERGQRTILWFDPQSAARVVREDELARLIEGFTPSETVDSFRPMRA